MKRILLSVCVVLSMLFGACSKKSSSPAEAKLDVKLSANAVEITPSQSFPFKVMVKSQLPAGGVNIKVDVKREDTNASVYSVNTTSTFADTDINISPLPSGQVYCVANVTVTSVATATNVWTGSFRVLWK